MNIKKLFCKLFGHDIAYIKYGNTDCSACRRCDKALEVIKNEDNYVNRRP